MPREEEYEDLLVKASETFEEFISQQSARPNFREIAQASGGGRRGSSLQKPCDTVVADGGGRRVPGLHQPCDTGPQRDGSRVGGPALSGGLGALAVALGTPGVTPDSVLPPGPADSDSRADARVLPVHYDNTQQRFRSFKDAVDLCEACEWPDWPVSGPRTSLWCFE